MSQTSGIRGTCWSLQSWDNQDNWSDILLYWQLYFVFVFVFAMLRVETIDRTYFCIGIFILFLYLYLQCLDWRQLIRHTFETLISRSETHSTGVNFIITILIVTPGRGCKTYHSRWAFSPHLKKGSLYLLEKNVKKGSFVWQQNVTTNLTEIRILIVMILMTKAMMISRPDMKGSDSGRSYMKINQSEP